MKIYKLQTKQELNASLETLWNFISSPKNLDEITPKELNFKITSEIPKKMYSGQIITYKIKILPLIYFTWVTEIKNVSENNYFIDEQRFGPYKFWHHQHKIESSGNKVIMHDIVHYAVPFGIFGKVLHFFLIRKKLENIFSYRKSYFENKFNK